jgi:inosine triphosphate pyrophosphatase
MIYFATESAERTNTDLDVKKVLSPEFNIDFVISDVDEIQGEPDAVCRAKSQAVGVALYTGSTLPPIIVETTSLLCYGLGGLPGPYMSDFITRLGLDGIHRMVQATGDTRATAQYTIALRRTIPGKGLVTCLFTGTCEGKIVAPRTSDWIGVSSYEPIFEPDEQADPEHPLTLAQMDEVQRLEISPCGNAARKLKLALTQSEV